MWVHVKAVLIFYYCKLLHRADYCLTYCHLILTLVKSVLVELESFMLFFICLVLAAYSHLGLLPYNPVINVCEFGFLSSFSKPVPEFRILRGNIMFYCYVSPTLPFKNHLMGVVWTCNILTHLQLINLK